MSGILRPCLREKIRLCTGLKLPQSKERVTRQPTAQHFQGSELPSSFQQQNSLVPRTFPPRQPFTAHRPLSFVLQIRTNPGGSVPLSHIFTLSFSLPLCCRRPISHENCRVVAYLEFQVPLHPQSLASGACTHRNGLPVAAALQGR